MLIAPPETFLCVARLDGKMAVPPSKSTKKKEKISFSTFADMAETAAKLYNRVEKLADAFPLARPRVVSTTKRGVRSTGLVR